MPRPSTDNLPVSSRTRSHAQRAGCKPAVATSKVTAGKKSAASSKGTPKVAASTTKNVAANKKTLKTKTAGTPGKTQPQHGRKGASNTQGAAKVRAGKKAATKKAVKVTAASSASSKRKQASTKKATTKKASATKKAPASSRAKKADASPRTAATNAARGTTSTAKTQTAKPTKARQATSSSAAPEPPTQPRPRTTTTKLVAVAATQSSSSAGSSSKHGASAQRVPSTKKGEAAVQAIARVRRSNSSTLDAHVDQLWSANERREGCVAAVGRARSTSSFSFLGAQSGSSSFSRSGSGRQTYMDDALDLELLAQRAAGIEIEVLSRRFRTDATYRLGRILSVGPQRTSELVRQASNHGARWDPHVRYQMIAKYRRGASIDVLAVEHGRTPWGIFCQLRDAGAVAEPEPTVEKAKRKLEQLLDAKAAIAEAPASLDDCAICMDAVAGVKFHPCQHHVCSTCAPHVDRCPLCRSAIQDRVVVYGADSIVLPPPRSTTQPHGTGSHTQHHGAADDDESDSDLLEYLDGGEYVNYNSDDDDESSSFSGAEEDFSFSSDEDDEGEFFDAPWNDHDAYGYRYNRFGGYQGWYGRSRYSYYSRYN